MKLSSSRLIPWACAALAALGIAVAGACSNQAEGDRCELKGENGGNDECQDPLECTDKNLTRGDGTARCCPRDRSQATTSVCGQPPGAVDSGPSSEGGGGAPDATTDGSGDSATEAAPPDSAPPDAASPDTGSWDTGAAQAPADG